MSGTPDWTDGNVHDPGVTLLELLAYTIEELAARPQTRLGGALLARIRRALDAPEATATSPAPCVTRTNFFSGRLLSAEDFQREQDYVRQRGRRLALVLSGPGLIRGLGVRVEGDAVVVSPGVAIDPHGEVLVVDTGRSVCLPTTTTAASVVVRYVERPDAFIPIAAGDGADTTVAGVIVECAEIALADTPSASDVVLARVERDEEGGALRLVR